MSFDGTFLHAMTAELVTTFVGGKVVKIQQPYPLEIIVTIRSHRHNYPLLLSANPSLARAQITEIPYANPKTAPNFVMTLRKYLENASVESIEQVENDRILRISLRSRDELGDQEDLLLVVEMMGRHSNIFLIEQATNRVIELIKHVSPDQNRYRLLMPGAQYLQPELSSGFDPFANEIATADWDQVWLQLHDLKNKPARVWQNFFQGLGTDTATELADRTKTARSATEMIAIVQNFWQTFDHVQPTIGQQNHKLQFAAISYQTFTDSVTSNFTTLSGMLDRFFGQKAESDRKHQLASNLLQRLNTVIKRNQKKLKKLQQTMASAQNSDEVRIKGEILMTYLREVPEHAKQVTLPNFYDDNRPLTIGLSPALTPAKNAQKYFTRYQKDKNAIIYVKTQLEETQAELDYLTGVLAQVEVGEPKDIEDIRVELEQQGIIRADKKKKKAKVKINPAEQFYASDGTSILVGKNNLQNDQLTLKKARKTDLWLHTKNIPGSHVIIQSDDPSEATILEAAKLAAYFSKARASSQVPVDYVKVKQIHKPNGAKPGFVIFTGQKTLYVTPERELVEQMRHQK
ncbi:Rqc2 family fibronectin-binding protein [Lapidilactobacillus bayanensis]|uniref:Rqc2 family fibronectin-binding protein n=1 Tax=Lapidilactobacillus bayanensis TaxID=2485998 RepID=UPI000F78DCAC|nr:NFACT RNA binding domain-containing protein [Lapidilactobacillus bayanensis]